MPIYIIGEEILNKKTECVVCPIKVSRLYLYEDICGKIYKKAGQIELSYLFDEVNPMAFAVPVITDGLALSDKIIHIIVSDFTLCQTFKMDMYQSYNDIVKLIVENGFKTIIMPPLCFSYKRLGNKNSYRTCAAFMRYFLDLYHVDCNVFIMVDKRTLNDHITNYVSTYISTSFPISKRHKPPVYPLTTIEEVNAFVKENKVIFHKKILQADNYNYELKNPKFENLYSLIKNKYESDAHFCFSANISKDEYRKLHEEEGYIPPKTTLLGICIALNLDIDQTNNILQDLLNEKLNNEDPGDSIILTYLEEKNYDIVSINEKLFYADQPQIGCYYNPAYQKQK